MEIKVVLFDAAGVLFPANKVVGKELGKTFNLSPDELSDMWSGMYKDLSTGVLSTQDFLKLFAERYNIPLKRVSADSFTSSFEHALEPMPGIENILKTLSENITLAILSDTAEMFMNARMKLSYFSYFEKQFLSFEIGALKPDPKTYQAVLDYYDIKPEQIFFTDDRIVNVEGAKKVEIDAELFTNVTTLTEQLQVRKPMK